MVVRNVKVVVVRSSFGDVFVIIVNIFDVTDRAGFDNVVGGV